MMGLCRCKLALASTPVVPHASRLDLVCLHQSHLSNGCPHLDEIASMPIAPNSRTRPHHLHASLLPAPQEPPQSCTHQLSHSSFSSFRILQ
uniref:Uncharacterized protein n=1 Tax=Triticum urartu TaxID=4572 RepID=A0A8R7V1G7_TRIUA